MSIFDDDHLALLKDFLYDALFRHFNFIQAFSVHRDAHQLGWSAIGVANATVIGIDATTSRFPQITIIERQDVEFFIFFPTKRTIHHNTVPAIKKASQEGSPSAAGNTPNSSATPPTVKA